MATILCIGDGPDIGCAPADVLRDAGHLLLSADGPAAAVVVASRSDVDLILADERVAGVSGRELLAALAAAQCTVPVAIITDDAHAGHPEAAITSGSGGSERGAAVHHIAKPLRPAQLLLAVQDIIEVEHLRRRALEARGGPEVVGGSSAIRRALEAAAAAAMTPAAVLVVGESGTGKAILARRIHDQSDRRERPFVAFHCAALAGGPVERALFGDGAEPASNGQRAMGGGAIERADGGTLLLEEISELPLDAQVRLLRVIADGQLEGTDKRTRARVNVRVIATSTRDLAAVVEAGRFNEELMRRLDEVVIRVPPLRDRLADIPLLAHYFARRAAGESGKAFTGISPEAIAVLEHRSWPDNVRELRHVVERALILSDAPILGPSVFADDHLDQRQPGARAQRNGSAGGEDGIVLHSLRIDDAESALIARALEVTGHNRTRAAALLGISVRTLRYKLNGPPSPRPPGAQSPQRPPRDAA